MFIPTITKQGTDEQKERWLPLSQDLKMIGTYAQTELGHGNDFLNVYGTFTQTLLIMGNIPLCKNNLNQKMGSGSH